MTEKISVADVTEQDYQLWKHHPVSKIFFRYLKDKREFIKNSAADQWIDGLLSLASDQCLRGQIIENFEIANMPFAAIFEFYNGETNGAETNQDI